MKVALLADSFPPHISGATTHYIELAYGLILKGHKVLILAPKPKSKIDIPPKIRKAKIVFLPSAPGMVTPTVRICIPNFPAVYRELKLFKPDIVEASSPSPLGIDALLSSKILKTPFISVFLTLFTSKEYLQSIFKTRISAKLERISWSYHRLLFNRSDAVFAITENSSRLLVKHGIKKNKILISPLLTDVKAARLLSEQQKNRLKAKYDLKKNVAVYVGRISIEKNLDFLLTAWSTVIKEDSNCTLLIIGAGPYEDKLKDLIKRLSLQENVKTLGAMPHNKLLSSGVLSICDLFISASTTETFGLSGLEAMAHKLPVVLAKSQGLSEMITKEGYVCPQNNADCFKNVIIKIFDNPKLKLELGNNAKKLADSLETSRAIEKVIENYKIVRKRYYNKHTGPRHFETFRNS